MTDDGPTPDRASVERALRSVEDPDLGVPVTEGPVVDDVRVDGGTVQIDATAAGLDPAMREDLTEAMRRAVLDLPGVEQVRVVEDARWDAGEGAGRGETGDGEATVPGVDRVVAVASAKGGVGKTTVAVGLARGLAAAGSDVAVLDADVHGPNVARVLGVEGPIEATDDGRARPVPAGELSVVSVGLLAGDAPLAWRGAMAHEAVTDLLTDTAWGADVLVVDLPPGTGDVPLTLLGSATVDGALLVTTPRPTAVEDTGRTAALLSEDGVPILGAVRNMVGATCPDCGTVHEPFGAGDPAGGNPAPTLDCRVLAELPVDPALRASLSPEEPVDDRFRELADAVADRLADLDGGVDEVPESALDLRGCPGPVRRERLLAAAEREAGGRLWVRTDRDPGSLVDGVAALAGCDPADLDPTVRRLDADDRALRLSLPASIEGATGGASAPAGRRGANSGGGDT